MKKAKVLAAFLSLTLGMTSLAAVPMTTTAEENIENVISETEIDENILYGDIKSGSRLYEMYTGDELDLSEMSLYLATYSGYYSDYPNAGLYNCRFTVGSGLYSDLYTLDTSKVDTTKAGDYKVIVKPKAGKVGTFTTKDNRSSTNPGYVAPDGDYDICMKGNESYIPVKVYDKEKAKDEPFYLRFYTEAIEVYLNEGVHVELVGALASDVKYEIEDETIVQLDEIYSTNKTLALNTLKEGETTVKVTASDGRTLTEKIKVLPPKPVKQDDDPHQTTTTTALGETTTTTTTTTVTVSTVSKWWYAFETTTTACSTVNTVTTTHTEPVTTVKTNTSIGGDEEGYTIYIAGALAGYSEVPDPTIYTGYKADSGRKYLINDEGTVIRIDPMDDTLIIDFHKGDDITEVKQIVTKYIPDAEFTDSSARVDVFYSDIPEETAQKIFDDLVEKKLTARFIYQHDRYKKYNLSNNDTGMYVYMGFLVTESYLYDEFNEDNVNIKNEPVDHPNTAMQIYYDVPTTTVQSITQSMENQKGDANCDGELSMTTGPAQTDVQTTATESGSYEKLTGIPNKIIYKKGEELDLSGIKTTDGKNAVISPKDVVITYLWNEKHTVEEFSSLKAGKYSVSVRNISFNVYIDDPDDENMYFQLENATVTVIEADNGISPEYAKFSGLNETFRYDADAGMSSEWNWVDIKTGDTVSGVLWTSLSVNNRAYIYKGDLTLIGRLGDANCDYELNMADAVLIMQSISNPDKYGENGTDKNHITEQGKKNADIAGENDGVTNADALAIQKKLLKLD